MELPRDAAEALELAKEELKRLDHLVYVSLKYTRTTEVFKEIIQKALNVFDFGFLALLLDEKKKAKADFEIVPLPGPRAEFVSRLFAGNENILNWIYFYFFLRKLHRAGYSSSQEFRKHVKMQTRVDEREVEITIDIITDYFQKIKEFVGWTERYVKGED